VLFQALTQCVDLRTIGLLLHGNAVGAKQRQLALIQNQFSMNGRNRRHHRMVR
jgi:hypothetical protein